MREFAESIGFDDDDCQDKTENTAAVARRKSKRVSFAGTKIIK